MKGNNIVQKLLLSINKTLLFITSPKNFLTSCLFYENAKVAHKMTFQVSDMKLVQNLICSCHVLRRCDFLPSGLNAWLDIKESCLPLKRAWNSEKSSLKKAVAWVWGTEAKSLIMLLWHLPFIPALPSVTVVSQYNCGIFKHAENHKQHNSRDTLGVLVLAV